jgi:hypothetical protein
MGLAIAARHLAASGTYSVRTRVTKGNRYGRSVATYVYYESGVSPCVAIRIDLLIILPMLFVNLIFVIRNLFRWLQKKPASS